jgi:hypothetical protein
MIQKTGSVARAAPGVGSIMRAAGSGLCAFEEHEQNGLRRESFLSWLGGARRTLCAFDELAHNGLASGSKCAEFLLSFGAAGSGLCASEELFVKACVSFPDDA